MKNGLPVWADNEGINASSAAKSAGIAIGSGLARLMASFLGALILARFLSPEEFGLVAIATPIILLMGAFADGGVSTHTLQAKVVTHKRLSISFWLAVGVGLLAAVITVSSAPLVVWIFSDDRLFLIMSVLALSVLFSSAGSQHSALAKKFHRQDIYGIAEIAAAVISLAGALTIAYLGGGYWALVAIPVFRQMTQSFVMWVGTGWRPGFYRLDPNTVKEVMGFSSFIIVAQVVSVLSKSVDKWMLGYHGSTEQLGFYAMAVSIMMLPSMQLLSPVAGAVIPYLSRVHHDNGQSLGMHLSRVNSLLLMIVWPAMLWAGWESTGLISVVLGDKWLNTSPIFSVLAMASVAMMQLSVIGWLFTAIGNSKVISNLSIISLLVLTVSSYFVAPYGAVAMAYAVFGNFFFMMLVFFYALHRDERFDENISSYMASVLAIILIGFLALGLSVFLLELTVFESSVYRLLVSFSLMLLVSILLYFPSYKILSKYVWKIRS